MEIRKFKEIDTLVFIESFSTYRYLKVTCKNNATSEASVNRSTHVVKDPQTNRLRVLTPVECERLNGFDDEWTNKGMTQKFRYFCMGNTLVVGLIERMGRKLDRIFELED